MSKSVSSSAVETSFCFIRPLIFFSYGAVLWSGIIVLCLFRSVFQRSFLFVRFFISVALGDFFCFQKIVLPYDIFRPVFITEFPARPFYHQVCRGHVTYSFIKRCVCLIFCAQSPSRLLTDTRTSVGISFISIMLFNLNVWFLPCSSYRPMPFASPSGRYPSIPQSLPDG